MYTPTLPKQILSLQQLFVYFASAPDGSPARCFYQTCEAVLPAELQPVRCQESRTGLPAQHCCGCPSFPPFIRHTRWKMKTLYKSFHLRPALPPHQESVPRTTGSSSCSAPHHPPMRSEEHTSELQSR